MESSKSKFYVILWFAAFLVYSLAAVESVPEETVLNSLWIKSLPASYPESAPEASLLPVDFGAYFGYVTADGRFSVLQERKNLLSQAADRWAEYEPVPSEITVRDGHGNAQFTIKSPNGYPFFLDNRVFLVSPEQVSVSEINAEGHRLWTRDFASPLTCVDAGGGLFLAGTLDGTLELLDNTGKSVYSFEPGGSRVALTAGCAISRDGQRFAVTAGIDEQRFLLLEKYGASYRVIYHEFLGPGFRRPVLVNFVDNDRRVVFERPGSLGIYDIERRESRRVPVDGEITAVDNQGGDGFLFAVTASGENEKKLYMIKYPNIIAGNADFESKDAFFGREEKRIYVGAGAALAAFEISRN